MSDLNSFQSVRFFEPWIKGPLNWPIQQKTSQLSTRSASLNPICLLCVEHLSAIEDHLLALGERDRYLRFGYHARDEHIKKYVHGLHLDQDRLMGIFNESDQLVAFAHLSLSRPKEFARCAEFGVSVDESLRGQGTGSRLFDYACLLARNSGVRMLFIHALSENTAMISIAKRHGATLERQGSETECYVKLPLGDFNSLMIEWSSQFISQSNLKLHEQSNRFWSFLQHQQTKRQEL
jgi:GNAT superfamily N-acetyltransferase